MSEIVKEKPIMEEAHKRYNNFIRSRLMMTEYEKKELYQYDKQITLKEERQEGRKDEKYSIAKTLKQMNMDNASISKATGLPINEVEKL